MTPIEIRAVFERELQRFTEENYSAKDDVLNQACAYGLLTPGKRVRPILLALVGQSFAKELQGWIEPAVAVEMIHAYSLVHDDLPAMDNDDFRRGQPSTHKKFGEDFAILAGDALLTDAFSLLARPNANITAEISLKMVRELSYAAGSQGMVYGQTLDIFFTKKELEQNSWKKLEVMHLKKTGALLGAACAMGACLARTDDATIGFFRQFGEIIGLAFQLRDDLLDEEAGIGKTTGKDAAQGKLSSLRMKSPNEVQSLVETLTADALESLRVVAEKKNLQIAELEKFTNDLLTRNS